MKMCTRWIMVMVGLMLAGCVPLAGGPGGRRAELQEILQRAGASEVLNADGTVKTKGPHILKEHVYFAKDANGNPVRRSWIQPAVAATRVGAPAAVFVSPALPMDGGPAVDFTGRPLWTISRPRAGGRQGQRSDCYRLAAMMAIAYERENLLPFLIQESPDGTVSVVFRPLYRGPSVGVTVVKMDHTVGSVGVDYDDVSDNAVADKFHQRAYAFFRYGMNTYSSLDWGSTGEVLSDMGFDCTAIGAGDRNAMTIIAASLANRMPVCVHTNGVTDGSLVGSHAYAVIGADPVAGTFLLRNPWFGNGDPDNTTIVTVKQLAANCSSVILATSVPVLTPAPAADVNLDGRVDFNDMTCVTGWWNRTGSVAGAADANGDGLVNFNDMLVVTGNWGLTVDAAKGVYGK